MASRKGAATAALLLLVAGGAPARTGSPRAGGGAGAGAGEVYEIPRALGPLVLDGSLDEPSWRYALTLELPFSRGGADPERAPVRTRCLLVRDDEQLYVGFVAHESAPQGMLLEPGPRDGVRGQDWVGLVVANGDARVPQLLVSASGVQADGRLDLASGELDLGWDAHWRSGSARGPEGYRVEAAIPLAVLAPAGEPDPVSADARAVWRVVALRSRPRGAAQMLSSAPLGEGGRPARLADAVALAAPAGPGPPAPPLVSGGLAVAGSAPAALGLAFLSRPGGGGAGRAPAAAPGAPETGLGLAEVVRITLEREAAILLQEQQVARASGAERSLAGSFDPTLSASLSARRDKIPYALEGSVLHQRSSEVRYGVRLDKRLRTGTVVSPSVQMARGALDGGVATGLGSVGLGVVQPLARGRGRVTAAPERAAGLERDASDLELEQTMAASALRSILAYWRYATSRRTLAILGASEERASRLVEETRELIAADERPPADLAQLQANRADKRASRIGAEQASFEARQELALAMGLDQADLARLPEPSDEPPVPAPQAIEGGDRTPEWVELALARRADRAAYALREEAVRERLASATDALKARWDLELDLGYAGLGLDLAPPYLASFWDNASGLNARAVLSHEWPVRNDAARGLLEQRQAEAAEVSIRKDDLERAIRSAVATAAADLGRNVQALAASREASRFHRNAVENEETRLRVGLSTVIDLILSQDLLTNAELREVGDVLAYASSLARLRYETGSLLARGPEGASFTVETVTRDPRVEPPDRDGEAPGEGAPGAGAGE